MDTIKILIAGNHQLTTDRDARLFEKIAEEIAFQAQTTTVLDQLMLNVELEKVKPDYLLLGFEIAEHKLLALAKEIKAHQPEVHVILLTNTFSTSGVKSALEANLHSHIARNMHLDDLQHVLKEILSGKQYFHFPSIQAADEKAEKNSLFSAIEKKLLQLIYLEHSNAQLAKALKLSQRTIMRLKADLKEKLQVKSDVGLAIKALELHLVE